MDADFQVFLPNAQGLLFPRQNLGEAKQQPTSPVVVLASLLRIHDLPDLHATMARREPSCRADGTGYIPFADGSFAGHPQRQQPVTSQLLVSEFFWQIHALYLPETGMFSAQHLSQSQFWLRASRSSHRFAELPQEVFLKLCRVANEDGQTLPPSYQVTVPGLEQ